jgi:hypothetical protein
MQRFKALIGSTFAFIFRTHWHHILWGAVMLTVISIVVMIVFANLLADVFDPLISLMEQTPLALLDDADVLQSSGEYSDIKTIMGEALSEHIRIAIMTNLNVFIPLYIIFILVAITTYLYFLMQSLYKKYNVWQVLKSVPKQIIRMISVVAAVLVAIYIPILLLSLLSYIAPSLYVLSGLIATIFVIAIIPAIALTPIIAVKESINGYKALLKNIQIARKYWKSIFASIIGFSIISSIAWILLLTILDFILQGLGFVLPGVLWGLLTLFSFMWAYCVYQAAITHFMVELETQY